MQDGCVIQATAHSDDYVFDVAFDAVPYFTQATDQEIILLAREDWGGGPVADQVARACENSGNRELDALFTYVRRKRGVGFECQVDEESALAWLKQKRATLRSKLDAGEAVTYVSQWDGGLAIKSPAHLNWLSGEVEILGDAVDAAGLEVLEREYIEFGDGTTLDVVQRNDGFFIDWP